MDTDTARALADAIDREDMYCPFQIRDGRVVDPGRDEHAPSVYVGTDDDEHSSDINVDGAGWYALTGYTGQYGYRGAVMHASETTGPGMAQDMAQASADHPGRVWVAVPVEAIGEDGEQEETPAGWAMLYRDDPQREAADLVALREAGGDVDEDGSARVKALIRAGVPGADRLAETYVTEADEVAEESQR